MHEQPLRLIECAVDAEVLVSAVNAVALLPHDHDDPYRYYLVHHEFVLPAVDDVVPDDVFVDVVWLHPNEVEIVVWA